LNEEMRHTASFLFNSAQEMLMQHEKLNSLRQSLISVSLGVVTLLATTASQAESPKVAAAKIEGAAAAASGLQIKPGKVPEGAKTTAAGAIGKTGDNQYPGTSPLPLPKPRKDALEAAGALKSKAAQ
jgi:hypothetical protein